MSQSSVIAFFLIIGFVVYVTMKGQLPAYAAILFGQSANESTQQTTTPQTVPQGLPNLPSMIGLGGILGG